MPPDQLKTLERPMTIEAGYWLADLKADEKIKCPEWLQRY